MRAHASAPSFRSEKGLEDCREQAALHLKAVLASADEYSPGHQAIREAKAREYQKRVEAAMAELPDQQREVMVLVCIEDMTYAEVAEILETPIGTVMSRLSRARINLAKMLGIE